jgi:nucleoside 2-deoxyribosyltransferase
MLIYFAHPNFNSKQLTERNLILSTLNTISQDIKVIDPFEINIDFDIKVEARKMFINNCNAISDANVIVANITEKDVGTAFEIGYAYAKDIKIILVDFNKIASQTNIMLSQGCNSYVRNIKDLVKVLKTDKDIIDMKEIINV